MYSSGCFAGAATAAVDSSAAVHHVSRRETEEGPREEQEQDEEEGEHSASPVGDGGTACSAPWQLLGSEDIDAAARRCFLAGSEGTGGCCARPGPGLRRSTSFTLYGEDFWVPRSMIGSCTREQVSGRLPSSDCVNGLPL